MLIGSCNQKVFNEYAFLIENVKTLTCFLCVKTSTKWQSSSFTTPELTSLAARPHRAALPSASAHRPISPSRLPDCWPQPYPGSFCCSSQGDGEHCHSTTRKVPFPPGPSAGLKLFFKLALSFGKLFHVQNTSEYKLLLN